MYERGVPADLITFACSGWPVLTHTSWSRERSGRFFTLCRRSKSFEVLVVLLELLKVAPSWGELAVLKRDV